MRISDFDLGWLVGVLEGEGYFEYDGCTQRVTIEMTDLDVIDTAARLIGRVIGKSVPVITLNPRSSSPDLKEVFRVCVCGESARTIMRLVAPHMHHRRRGRVWQSLNKYKPPKQRSLAEMGLSIDGILEMIKE